jgi:carbon-monoxide dehydrogenase small subunit
MAEVAVSMTVNGQGQTAAVEPRKTLADFLREDCRLTGTHLGCEHGVCGACTVVLDGRAVRSCLVFAVQADGLDVTTVEGLAGEGELNPDPTDDQIRQGLSGNICRCTGYQGILRAVRRAAEDMKG